MDEKMPMGNKMPDTPHDEENKTKTPKKTAEEIMREIEENDKKWVIEKMGDANDRDAQ